MMEQLTHTAVLGQGLFRGLQDWWWDWNFRGYGHSVFAEHTDWLFFWIWAISAFFFVLLMVLMVLFTFKYRRRPGAVPMRSRSHNTALELTWSIVPTIILVWMFFEGFRGYANKMVAPAAAPEVLITGQTWMWSITYPNGAISQESTRSRTMGGERSRGEGIVETPIFVMPEQTPVKLRMHSRDVIHAFWIPDFRVKFDVYPNRYTSMWFESNAIDTERAERMGWVLMGEEEDEQGNVRQVPLVDDEGNPVYYQDHWVFCAEYCGQSHSEMAAIIRIVPREHYLRIIQGWTRIEGPPHVVGEFLFHRAYGCAACHTVDGRTNTGPTMLNNYGYPRVLTDGRTVEMDADYIRRAILEPRAETRQGYPDLMPSYMGQITEEEEMNALIAYIQSLSDRGPPIELPENGEQPEN